MPTPSCPTCCSLPTSSRPSKSASRRGGRSSRRALCSVCPRPPSRRRSPSSMATAARGCPPTCCRPSATTSARTPSSASTSRASSSTPTGRAPPAGSPPTPTRLRATEAGWCHLAGVGPATASQRSARGGPAALFPPLSGGVFPVKWEDIRESLTRPTLPPEDRQEAALLGASCSRATSSRAQWSSQVVVRVADVNVRSRSRWCGCTQNTEHRSRALGSA